jgi:hypothetical protein
MSSKRTRLAPIEVPDPANILSAIPGEFIAAAAIELPDAETCEEEYQQAILMVPGQGRVLFTFRRFDYKRGKMRRWFWTAERAVRLQNE